MSFGFGQLPQQPVNLADLARLFDPASFGMPQGFAGTSGQIVEPPAPLQAQAAPSSMFQPNPTQAVPPPAPLAPSQVGAPVAPDFTPPPMPAPPATPPTGFGFGPIAPPPAPAPAPETTGSVRAPQSASSGGFLDALAKPSVYNTLLGIGAGLMSTPGLGQGFAAGIGNASQLARQQSVTDLAQVEMALKAQKLAKERQGENATAAYLRSKGLDDAAASAAVANPSVLTNVLGQLNKDPSRVTIGGNIYELKPGDKPSPSNLLGPAKEQESYGLEPDGRGNLWKVNKATNERTIALQGGKPELTEIGVGSGLRQKAFVGPDGNFTPIGEPYQPGAANSISFPQEKEQDKTLGKGYGEYQLDLAKQGRNAGQSINTLNVMEQAARSPQFYSGFGAEQLRKANQLAVGLGIKDANYSSPTEVFDALSNKVVLDGLGGSLGPGISNTDRDYIGRTAPSLERTEAGNMQLIGIARALAQRQQEVSALARDYAAKNGGRLDAGFDQALDDFAKNKPLFPSAQQGASASAPKEPPQGAPTGARQAGDGKWYVPDPNRPGKYLQVQ